MVLMSASSKAPIKAFPCDGLFALKISRSNPETGHQINPMALSAHYKAFCTVMISLHVCQPVLEQSHDNNWENIILLLRAASRDFFVAIVGGTNCKIGGRRAAKMGLVTPPLTLSLLQQLSGAV